jgi:ABC-2 type transport system ATP-binding protein
MITTPPVLAEGLTKRYADRTALADVSLEAPAGSVLGLLGPNGAGKTTLIRILTTLIRPDAGRAVVPAHDVATDPEAVRRAIGLVGQHAAVDEYLSGRSRYRQPPAALGAHRRPRREWHDNPAHHPVPRRSRPPGTQRRRARRRTSRRDRNA